MTTFAVGYLRQSVAKERDDKDGGSVSTAFQLNAAQQWCERNDAKLVAWFSDVDESGASTTRTGLDAFLAEVERLRPHYAVFWDLKRLTRNLRLFLDVFERLERCGTQMVSVTEGTRHPPFVWKLLALMAEEERDRIAVNITHGKREATKRGRHLGYPPLGYRRDDDGALVIDPDTAWIIEWIYARALEGHTPTAICRMANAQGIPTTGVVRIRKRVAGAAEPVGPASPESHPVWHDSTTPQCSDSITRWSRQTILAVLRRPTYAGLVQSGAGSRSRYGQSLGVVTAEGTHQAIIPRDRWETVQRTLDGFAVPSARRGSWHWLNGRVFCAACSARLYYVDAARSDGTGRDQYWRCRNSYLRTFGRDNEACPSPKRRISDRVLDRMVRDALSGALRAILPPERIIDHLTRQHGAQTVSARERAERELAELQAQRIAINDAIQMRVGDLADLAVRDRALVAEIAALRDRLATLPTPTPLHEIARTVAALEAAAATVPRMTDAQRAAFAATIDLRVTVDLARQTVTLGYRADVAAAFGSD